MMAPKTTWPAASFALVVLVRMALRARGRVRDQLLQRGLDAGGQRDARDVQHHRDEAVVADRAHQVHHAALTKGRLHTRKGGVRYLARREQLGDEVVRDRFVFQLGRASWRE